MELSHGWFMPFLVSSSRRHLLAATASCGALLVAASLATAHDFWLVPHLFAFSGDSVVVNGKSGTRFPAGAPVQPARVAEAWLISDASRTKITAIAVMDSALRLNHRPAAGQYRVAVALTPRPSRTTPAGLLRFLRLEGGAAAADQLERERTLVGHDSVVFTGTSYAATIVQVGRGGPRGFSSTAGFPLEFVAMSDPAALRVGDTLHVRVLGGGRPAAHIGLDAMPADSGAPAGAGEESPWHAFTADATGVVHIPLRRSGAWLLRSAWVSRRAGAAANEFDVARSTFVFNVMGR